MKILSKYKDYYDFQVGVYGEDPALLFDRRNGNAKTSIELDTILTLFIGNKVIQGIHKDDQFYWGEDMLAFSSKSNSAKWYLRFRNNAKLVFEFNDKGSKIPHVLYHIELEEISSQVKFEYEKYCQNYPTCLYIEDLGAIPNPKLEAIGINKVIEPRTIWQEVSDYLSAIKQKMEKDVPIGNDDVRLEARGFDLKTSFRNIK